MKKCQTCSKVIEDDEVCFCELEGKGMTPEEIVFSWREGKTLEYSGDTVTGVQLRVFTGTGLNTYYHDYPCRIANIREVSLKRETFGFYEARKRMSDGKRVGKENCNYIYRMTKCDATTVLLRSKNIVAEGSAWKTIEGYPLDWPDSVDFYEVVE